MVGETDSEYDGRILHRERDVQLGLVDSQWPHGCPLGGKDEQPARGASKWAHRDGYMYRTISPLKEHLWEVMMRFPNAPVYGFHSRPGQLPQVEGRSNFHTMRIIGQMRNLGPDDLPNDRVRHVYVLHNGLNETSDARLHYELASRLLRKAGDGSICIIRPFQGHLNRYPYSDRFAEKPLDGYLLDSGNLFRQFIRFMLETRWLLSILTPRTRYSVITGGKLVDPDAQHSSSKLAERIYAEWRAMDTASKDDPSRLDLEVDDVDAPILKRSIETLRGLLNWHSVLDADLPGPAADEPPAIHMVGYSLGSFLAQSAFFAWPYAISGCVTLFGGGELRKLAPTAFAQPEEWQSVLHSLRYELDRAMQGPLLPKDKKVRGIERETFEYLQRVFYEVFLQYYQGSYRTRLAEFVQRMLFVTGGEDPIVRPGNVLEAAPPEGVNLINIAGMSHFPMKPRALVQEQQREHWLEQLGQIIPTFSEQADRRRREVLSRSWLNDRGTALHDEAEKAYVAYKEKLDEVGEPPSEGRVTSATPLSDRWFGKEIEHICDFIAEGAGGWVLVSRNEIPPVFQTEDVLRRYAAGLHHSEDLAADEFWLASRRRDVLLANRPRVTLLLSEMALEIGFEEEPALFPPRSETPGVPRLPEERLLAAKTYFEKNWQRPKPSALRVLKARGFRPSQLGDIGRAVAKRELDPGAEDSVIELRFLPDAWIGIHPDLLASLQTKYGGKYPEGSRSRAEHSILGWATALARERAGEGRSKAAGSRLDKARREREVLIVQFSRAGLNPRYRGQRLSDAKRTGDVLIQWALSYKATTVRDRRRQAH